MTTSSSRELLSDLLAGRSTEPGDGLAIGEFLATRVFTTSVFSDGRAGALTGTGTATPGYREAAENELFTEPIEGPDHHSWLEANLQDVLEMRADTGYVTAIADAKYMFMTQTEAMIFGDGSGDFFGPAAFDIGNAWAAYVVAAVRSYANDDDEHARAILGGVAELWDGFEREFRRLWPERRDARLWDQEFLDRLLYRWRNEAWLYSAPHLARRAMDASRKETAFHATQNEALHPRQREGAVRGGLRAARSATSERWVDSSPGHYMQLMEWLLVEARRL